MVEISSAGEEEGPGHHRELGEHLRGLPILRPVATLEAHHGHGRAPSPMGGGLHGLYPRRTLALRGGEVLSSALVALGREGAMAIWGLSMAVA